MKKVIIILLIAVAIAIIIKYVKKVKDVAKLQISLKTFYFEDNLKSLKNATTLLSNLTSLILPTWFVVHIENFGESKYTINNVYVQAFNKSSLLVADPAVPFNSKVIVQGKTGTDIKIKYNLTVPGLLALAKEAGITGANKEVIIKLLTNYFTTGKLGVTLMLKGYVNAEGIKILDIPVNETQNI